MADHDQPERGERFSTDVELWSLEDVHPYANNPKEHPDEQIEKIRSSIKNYGFDQPLVVDADGEIIKGHGRRLAAKSLGLENVPVLVRDDLSEGEKKAARIADNRTSESGWDTETLAAEFEALKDHDDLEFGVSTATAFDEGEIEDYFTALNEGGWCGYGGFYGGEFAAGFRGAAVQCLGYDAGVLDAAS